MLHQPHPFLLMFMIMTTLINLGIRMPHSCVIQGCFNRSNKAGCKHLSFHPLPLANAHILRLWIIKAKLPQRLINRNSRICSVHFLDGKRKDVEDVPTQFPWTPLPRKLPTRHSLPDTSQSPDIATLECSPETPAIVESYQPTIADTAHGNHTSTIISPIEHDHTYCIPSTLDGLSCITDDELVLLESSTNTADVSIQCNISSTAHSSVQCSLLEKAFRISELSNDNSAIHFYTGFPDYTSLLCCFDFLGEAAHNLKYWYGSKNKSSEISNKGPSRALTPLNEFFLVLCRLRLGLLERDLAYRFGVSQSTVSRICITWINFLYVKFKEVPIWPSREHVNENMPKCFRESYPSTRCIIDATEIYIQQPSSPLAQQLTFSSYKNHNTLKAIVGITPSGAVCFASKLFGGCISDKELTKQCGILDLLQQGDSVMADRGFMIADLLSSKGVDLNIPPSKLLPQLTESELVETRRIASVRIHVERAIGRLKLYHILDNIPNCMAGIADRIFYICTVFTNFLKPLI